MKPTPFQLHHADEPIAGIVRRNRNRADTRKAQLLEAHATTSAYYRQHSRRKSTDIAGRTPLGRRTSIPHTDS